jgi:hypothetical protein
MILQIPLNAKTYELTGSTFWFSEEGILYSMPKPGAEQEATDEQILQEMEKFRVIVGNKKVCMIAETAQGTTKPPKKEQRALIAREIASVTKALAIVTTSALSKMIINLFFAFAPPQYPVKIFRTEQEAREWIRQYL